MVFILIALGKRNAMFLFITRSTFLLEGKLNMHGKFSIIQNWSVEIMHKFEYLSKLKETPKGFCKTIQNLEKWWTYNNNSVAFQWVWEKVCHNKKVFSLATSNVLSCFVPAWSFSLCVLTEAWNYYLLVINLLRFHCCGLICRFWLTADCLSHYEVRV